MDKYKITNRSSQDGTVSVGGKWITVRPGESLETSHPVGDKTPNLSIRVVRDGDTSVTTALNVKSKKKPELRVEDIKDDTVSSKDVKPVTIDSIKE